MIEKARHIDSPLPKEMEEHHYPILFEVEESHWWYVGRRRIIEAFVQDICAGLKPGRPRILDVGCGTGANLKMLGAHGEVAGVDISQQALEFCRQRGLETVRFGAAESLPYEDESFDLVTALDVIEHLDDDLTGLREIGRVLRPRGRLLLFVPAFMFLWGVQDEVSNHRRRYDRADLVRKVSEAGFEIEQISYANVTFFLPVLVVRWIMRIFKIRAETEYGINFPALNRPLAALFAAERLVLQRSGFPFGVSLICVARKRP
ncbi:MAG TPA: methyltransferase domain-containing protein [Pyrinomonadaceae bacterium]|nr:methyltransferase domain-containing protein [Pyrinomonadaceae bacterium]